MNKKSIIFIILILLIVAGGVFWWWQSQPKDQIPEGVTIIKEKDKKLIKNEVEGYEIEIPKAFIVKGKESSKLEVLSKENILMQTEGYFHSELLINRIENPQNLSLENWLQKQHEEFGFLYWDQREKVEINDILGYKIETEGPIEDYHYFFARNSKIYVVTIPCSSEYLYLIESFRLR